MRILLGSTTAFAAACAVATLYTRQILDSLTKDLPEDQKGSLLVRIREAADSIQRKEGLFSATTREHARLILQLPSKQFIDTTHFSSRPPLNLVTALEKNALKICEGAILVFHDWHSIDLITYESVFPQIHRVPTRKAFVDHQYARYDSVIAYIREINAQIGERLGGVIITGPKHGEQRLKDTLLASVVQLDLDSVVHVPTSQTINETPVFTRENGTFSRKGTLLDLRLRKLTLPHPFVACAPQNGTKGGIVFGATYPSVCDDLMQFAQKAFP